MEKEAETEGKLMGCILEKVGKRKWAWLGAELREEDLDPVQ